MRLWLDSIEHFNIAREKKQPTIKQYAALVLCIINCKRYSENKEEKVLEISLGSDRFEEKAKK